MYYHQLLVVLVLVHATAGSSPLTVNVSAKGIDDSSCLHENTTQACRSLEFVLKQLSSPIGSDVILVNVFDNQSLNTIHDFTDIVNPFTLVVTGVGYPSITFSSLTLAGNTLSMSWRGLVFSGIEFHHQEIHAVTIVDCKIHLSLLIVRNVRKVIIDESDYIGTTQIPNAVCPSIRLASYACTPGNVSSVVFSSNTITNCQVRSLIPNLLTINTFCNATIINNEFTHVNLTAAYRFVIVYNITSLTFQNNSFVKNIMGAGIEFHISGSNGLVTIQQNRFLHNVKMVTRPLHDFIFFFYEIHNSNLSVTFSKNLYHNNSELLFLSFLVEPTNSTVMVTLDSESLTDNIGPSRYTPNECTPSTDNTACFGLFIFEGCTVVNLSNITASNNRINIDTIVIPRGDEVVSQDRYYSSLFFLSNVTNMFLSNTLFNNNYGTPIIFWHTVVKPEDKGLDPASLTLSGNILFANNIGTLGGAFAAYNKDIDIHSKSSTRLTFIGNSALYGGAGFIEKMAFKVKDNLTINFTDNNAVTNGDAIYFSTDPSATAESFASKIATLNTVDGIRSYAKKLSYVPNLSNTQQPIFPGQELIVNISITDYFGQPSSCTADIYLQCDNRLLACQQVKLKGPETVVLTQADNTTSATINTNHILVSPQDVANSSVSVLLLCRNIDNTQLVIPLNITRCPPGFYYSQTERVCKCVEGVSDSTLFVCSSRYGGSCVAHGYWYGEIATTTAYTVSKCSFPECDISYEACPSELLPAGATGGFARLRFNPDSQCSEGRGGVLCGNCVKDYVFTFTASSCVSESTCGFWQPFLILLLSTVFQVTIAFMLFFLVRFKFALGSGFLYGPMFFLAIVHHLPLDNYPFLNTAVSVMSSIPLLNLELFGLIPWCFFHPFSKLYNYFLHYLGPLIVLIVILLIFLFARWCSNMLRRIQTSPLRALCILMLLSFWSLSDISLNILTPVVIQYKAGLSISTGLFVSIQPDIEYFSLPHIPVAIPALLVMILVIAPLVFILLASPFLSKVTNLSRIKPFLDEFQSCYDDKFRWYSAVYFIVWIALIISLVYSDVFAYQTILVLLLLTHTVLQPYSSMTLNIVDALLLTDINFLIVLINFYPASFISTQIAVYLLVIGPLLCAGAYLIYYLVIVKLWTCIKSARNIKENVEQLRLADEGDEVQRHNVPVQHVYVDECREPLLAIVNAE